MLDVAWRDGGYTSMNELFNSAPTCTEGNVFRSDYRRMFSAHRTSVLWWVRWRPGPAGGTAGHCGLRSQESGVRGGEGGSGKRRGRHPVLPPPLPPRLPPPGAEGGEEPCDRPAGRAAPLRSRCRPARICRPGRGLERQR